MHFDQALHLLQTVGPEMEQKGLRIASRFYKQLEDKHSSTLQEFESQTTASQSLELRILRLGQLLKHVTNQEESSELFKLILLNEINQTKSFIMTYPEIVSTELLLAIQTELELAPTDPVMEAWEVVHHQLVETCRHFYKYKTQGNWARLDVLLVAENHHLGAVIDEARYALMSGRKTTILHVRNKKPSSKKLATALNVLTKQGLIFHSMQTEEWDEQLEQFLRLISIGDPITFASGSSRFITEVQRTLEPLPVIFSPFVADGVLPS
ncbi:hypothetical protein D3D03_02290 [Exiguobacterium sp. RIT452]|uniref:hypothetical protein n=1 Tax=Exiguobacterium sp. RIT452 TaxID=2315552 RepID=UPI000E72A0AF|nr:hypothetical protein [Exiguobacterium sp. RIT452]RJP02190.1 hypothetical protein D3D03_02290 [Exiguobacterium sp. RIT452]